LEFHPSVSSSIELLVPFKRELNHVGAQTAADHTEAELSGRLHGASAEANTNVQHSLVGPQASQMAQNSTILLCAA
jgi:hypothetical protein